MAEKKNDNSVPLLTASKQPFDPIKIAEKIEKAVCIDDKKKYYCFRITPQNYRVGVATGYTVGCCLQCIFCWANETRDNIEKTSAFYSPDEVFDRLADLVREKKQINQIRISDGEPTIGKSHLLKLLELTERSNIGKFILETNGILLGYDSNYVKSLAQFKKLYVRLSLKAGTPSDFTHKTGAIPEAFEFPFEAIRKLIKHSISFNVAAMSADPRFMSPTERISLIAKLAGIDPGLVLKLEEEMVILFPTTMDRLKVSGWIFNEANHPTLIRKIPALKRYVQVSYNPLSSLQCQKISARFTIKAIREMFYGI